MKHPIAIEGHMFMQAWLLLISVILFGIFVAFDKGYFQMMLAADQSRLSICILLLFSGASLHAAWHIFSVAKQLHHLRKDNAVAETLADYYKTDIAGAGEQEKAQILEVYADRLRGAVETGWYIVDILVRLGLVGTVIGFILILGTLADGRDINPENVQSLLISMSGGMGIALYTTLTGLITSMLLGIQYMILGRGVEQLIAGLILLDKQRETESPTAAVLSSAAVTAS